MIRSGTAVSILLLLAGCASAPKAPVSRPAAVWETEFQYPVSWHKSMGDDLLVVGTTRHLFGVDPRTGKRLWRLRNVNTNARDVYQIVGEAYVLVNDAAGGAFDDTQSHILAVDRVDGVLLWETPVLPGRVLQARLDLANDRLIAVTVRGAHGDDAGLLSDVLPNKGLFSGFEGEPELVMIDLIDGRLLWHQPFGEEVLMRPSHRRGAGGAGARAKARPFDLGLYHPPVLLGEQVCVTYGGIHCYRAEDGQPTWHDDFDVIEDELALSYPEPVVGGDRVIVGDTDRAYAMRASDGRRLWRSEHFGRMPEFIDDEERLLVQIGGRYFDLDDEAWVAKGGFGVAAISKEDGETQWEYGRVRRSITNLLPTVDRVWFADEDHLFALDRETGEVLVRAPHKLGELPNFVALNQNNQVVVISESEIGGYDRDGGLRWYEAYPPPGPGVWKRLAGALMTASGAIFKLSSHVIAYGGVSSFTGKSVVEDATGSLGRSLLDKGQAMRAENGYANLTGDVQYFLTRPRGLDEVVLAAVDINAGQTRELTVLPYQNPELVIDEINGMVYQAVGKRLLAVPLGQ